MKINKATCGLPPVMVFTDITRKAITLSVIPILKMTQTVSAVIPSTVCTQTEKAVYGWVHPEGLIAFITIPILLPATKILSVKPTA